MKIKTLKTKINELPDEWQVLKVHIETVNTHGYPQTIEFDIKKNNLIIKKDENDKKN